MNKYNKSHVCERSKTCCCYMLADEPAENCPVHGMGEYPPRCCICGKFMKIYDEQEKEQLLQIMEEDFKEQLQEAFTKLQSDEFSGFMRMSPPEETRIIIRDKT